MAKYPVRPSHRANLSLDALETLCREHFEQAERSGSLIRSRYGAIAELTVGPEGRELALEVKMDPKVPEPVAKETIRRYNLFLEAVTGYTSKERAKRLQKAAKAAAAGA